jgi:hypothetical protein
MVGKARQQLYKCRSPSALLLRQPSNLLPLPCSSPVNFRPISLYCQLYSAAIHCFSIQFVEDIVDAGQP